jgi:hypothetical protein
MKLLVLKKSKDYGEKLRKPQERRGDTPGDRLEHFRKLILDHLDTLDGDVMKKAGLPVGTVREWKGGQKYVKVGPNKWRPKYDSESRGAKMAVAAIRRKIAAAKDAHEMMSIVLEHRDRFSGKDGQPLPFVQELHSYVMSAQEGREKAEKKKAVADKKKDKPEEKESGKTGTKDTESDEKSVEEWEQAGADAFKAGKPRKPPYDEIVKTGTKIGSPESKEADKKMKAWLRGWTKADASSELSDKKVKQKNTPLYQTGDYKVKQRGENDFVVTDKDGNVLPHFGIGGKSDTFADIHGAKKHADLRAKLDEDKKNKKMPDPEQLKKLKEAAEAEKNEYNNAFIELYKNGMITEKQAVAKLTNRKNPNRKTVAEERKLLGEDKPMEGGLYDKEKETDAPESGDDNAAAFKAIQEKYRSAKSVTGDEDEIAV